VLYKNLNIKTYRSIILPVVLYGCEIWSLTLREESRLMFFESRLLRRIFGVMTDGETGEWTKLQNKELHYLHYSPNILQIIKIDKNEISRVCNAYGEEREYKGL